LADFLGWRQKSLRRCGRLRDPYDRHDGAWGAEEPAEGVRYIHRPLDAF